MKKIMKLSAALAIAAIAGSASAQISNTVYFDKYNYRQHHLNPAMLPDQRFYFSVIGNTAMDFGNKSISFSDVVKNVNGKTVLFLDKEINSGSDKKGQNDFLKALGNKLHLFANAYIDIFDFGFRMGDKSFLGFSVGAKIGTNTMIPKQFFSVILGGMKKDETFNLDAGSLYFDVYGYAEAGVTFAHQFGEKLNLGITGKYLWGGANIKTKFDDIKITGSMDEWKMKGNAEIMASFPGLVAYNNAKGELKIENDLDDDGNEITWRDFKGNNGFALDLGATYKLFDKLTLAASIDDLGFIRFKKNTAKIRMHKDFVYNGAEFKQDDKRDENGVRESGELDFKKYEDEFEQTFTALDDNKFVQGLHTKIYLGASWEPIKIIGFGVLSKSTFAHKKLWQEFSLSANFHPIRLFSINGIYSMMDGSWHALGLGANLNLGFLNIFAACDNIPVHYGKSTKDDIIFPDKLTSTRFNVGLGFIFGSKEHKDKKKAKKEEKENILDANWRNEPPEPDFFDADGDGVEDYYDRCAETQAGVEVDENGCPLDSDHDGVADYLDKCPDTPSGSQVDENGCTIDSDGDGIDDNNDKCPNTPSGVQVDNQGCPLDADADGVPDYLDKCANSPSSAKVDASGCPVDTDKDGIPDYMDKCPDVAGIAENNGCPEVKQEVKQLFRKALNGIQFASGKSTILSSSYKILDDIAKTMKENPEYNLFIKGHTDNDGKADMNLQLSKDRAEAVRKYLISKGVSEARMHSEGYGDTMPLVPNNSAANKAKNRRVEFEVEFY